MVAQSIDDLVEEVLKAGSTANYSGTSTQSISATNKLTAKDVKEAVELIRKHRVKPRWGIIRQFPFITKVYKYPWRIRDITS